MNGDLIKKYVASKRSSVNQLAGIVKLDISPENNSTMTAYKAIEGLAEKHEKFKIKNEKNDIIVKLNKMDQEFQANYLNDPTVYTDQVKFDNMVVAYNDQISKKREIINTSEYLTKQDVQGFINSQELADGEKLNNLQYKRNQMFIKETYDTALINRTQLEQIGANLDPTDKERFKQVLKGLGETATSLEQTGMSKSKIAAMIGESVANMEFSRDNKELIPIINNPNISYEEKISIIDRYKKSAGSQEFANQITDIYNKDFGFEGEYLEIFKQSFMSRGGITSSGQDRELLGIERNLYTQQKNAIDLQKQLEKDKKAAVKTDDKVRRAINENKPYDFVEAKFNIVPTTKEFVSDNYLLEETFNTSLSEIGSRGNRDVADIVATGDLQRIKQEIAAYTTDGRTPQEIIDEVIFPFADELATNDSYKRTAILKNLGLKLRGYSPTLLLNASERPNMVITNTSYNLGKNMKKEIEVESPTWLDEKLTRDNSRTRYFNLTSALGATPIAKEKLNTLIVGKMKQAGYTKFTAIDVETYLEDDNSFLDLQNSLQDLRDLQISPVNYRYKNIRTDTLEGDKQTQTGGIANGFTGIRRK